MIRTLLRFFSLCLLAIAFITLIIDATRSFVTGKLSVTPIGESLSALAPAPWASVQTYIGQHVPPFVWNFIFLEVIELPIWLGLGAAGSLVAWAARNPARKFGFSSR